MNGLDVCECGHTGRIHGSRPGLELPDDRCRACDCDTFEPPDLRDPTDLGLPNLPPVHACRNGWIGDDEHPIPCPRCRPHLQRSIDRAGMTAWRPTTTTKEAHR